MADEGLITLRSSIRFELTEWCHISQNLDMRANLPQEIPHLPREMWLHLHIAGYVALLTIPMSINSIDKKELDAYLRFCCQENLSYEFHGYLV